MTPWPTQPQLQASHHQLSIFTLLFPIKLPSTSGKMAETLAESMAKLQLQATDSNDDELIDSILDITPPSTKQAQDKDAMKAELERKYLTPSTTFSEPWLNRLQQYVIPTPLGFKFEHQHPSRWQLKRLAEALDALASNTLHFEHKLTINPQTLVYPNRLHRPLHSSAHANSHNHPLHTRGLGRQGYRLQRGHSASQLEHSKKLHLPPPQARQPRRFCKRSSRLLPLCSGRIGGRGTSGGVRG